MKTKTISFRVTAKQAAAISAYGNDCLNELYPGFSYSIMPADKPKNFFLVSFSFEDTRNEALLFKDLFDFSFYAGRESVFITE